MGKRDDAGTEQHTANPWRYAASAMLLTVGCALFVFGGALWLVHSTPGASTVKKSSTTTVTKPAGDAGATTTTVESLDTTTPGAPTLRSETLAATLFGLGAILILSGAFFPRILRIGLPGGGSLELAPEAQAKVVQKTMTAALDHGVDLDPDVVASIYQEAVSSLLTYPVPYPSMPVGSMPSYPGLGTSPPDDVIDSAVERAVGRVSPDD